jgi:RHS repeat-associated protein
VTDGGGTQRAYTTYTYDAGSLVSSGISTQHDSSPPSGSYRGNLTLTSRWLNYSTGATGNCPISVSNGYLNNYFVFNDTGTVSHTVDACGTSASDSNHITNFSYSPTSACSTSFAGAYPTVVTNALGQTTSYCYDFNTGLKISETDPNNQTTSYLYNYMNRTSQISYPDGGLTTFCYTDMTSCAESAPYDAVVITEKMNSTGQNRISAAEVDGFGREIRRNTTNGESTPYDQIDTCYDSFGRISYKSYPYQSSGLSTALCSGAGDALAYDALSRKTSVTHSDGSSMVTSYTGSATSVTDEGNGTVGVQRISQLDGLGRMTSLCEVSGSLSVGISGSQSASACGLAISGTGFLTSYSYDTLDNLTSVTQGPLNTRTFVYDSLSRLEQATNPESGAICYGQLSGGSSGTCLLNGYDANGNLNYRTDARGTITTSYYDYLNRIIQKNYSDSTPTLYFSYDVAPYWMSGLTNLVGRLVLAYNQYVWNSSNGTDTVNSYDSMGRIVQQLQQTPSISPSFATLNYTYDLVGDMLSSTNGFGLTLNYAVNQAGRLTTLSDNATAFGSAGALFSSAHYNAAGSIATVQLGNGISELRVYDSRLRLSGIADGGVYALAIPTYAPDDDILISQDSINGDWTYTYDAFNRLSTASATGQSYTYAYDRFGNRWQQNGPHSSILGFDANNHMVPGGGVTYDAAGNVTNDGTTAYTYDAETRITSAVNSSAGTSTYVYDAFGKRIRKTTSTGAVDFVYDLAGHEIAQVNGSTWMRGEIYTPDRHLATFNYGTTFYNHSDWLGTERARSTNAGASYEICTSLPFGDWWTCSGADPSPMHLTGKEHDYESDLDYFGARYDSSQYGRFMTPDWSVKPQGVPYAVLGNPQSLNLYSYVENNPVTDRDSDGHAGGFECVMNKPKCDAPDPETHETKNAQAQNKNQNPITQQDQKKVAALVCAESCTTTKNEQKAVASAILNRANSGDKQYVGKGQDVNVTNVVQSGQFQGYSTNASSTYQQALAGKLDEQPGFQSAQGAVADVMTNGATTNATFVYYGNSPPSSGWMGNAVQTGNLVPATPAQVGNWYLYVPK